MPRKSREDWKTYKNVFDSFTERTIFKLMSRHVIDGLQGPVKIGKESNIFTAASRKGTVIVKIYRLEGCNFNKMYEYIRQDERYSSMKKARRDIIFSWVQREYRNLMKARDAGVRVPAPYSFLNNCIVMEMIGDSRPALQLKDSTPTDMDRFLKSLIKSISLLYSKAGIVHGDLSEFNILNYRQNPVLIDFSQGTMADSQNAQELMKRDLENIKRFYAKHGKMVDIDQILAEVADK